MPFKIRGRLLHCGFPSPPGRHIHHQMPLGVGQQVCSFGGLTWNPKSFGTACLDFEWSTNRLQPVRSSAEHCFSDISVYYDYVCIYRDRTVTNNDILWLNVCEQLGFMNKISLPVWLPACLSQISKIYLNELFPCWSWGTLGSESVKREKPVPSTGHHSQWSPTNTTFHVQRSWVNYLYQKPVF